MSKVTPKRIKRANGTVLTPEMSTMVTTAQHTNAPFYNGANMKTIKHRSLWITIIVLLVLICFSLLLIPESQLPTILQSSSLVAIISTFLGVMMTVAVTAMLLEKQAETQKDLLKNQSEADAQKDKDVKIYEQKIKVYSTFVSTMWNMFANYQITKDELSTLRNKCFEELVFHLDAAQIQKISDEIEKIDPEANEDVVQKAIGEITGILQKNLRPDSEKISGGILQKMYNSFKIPKDIIQEENDQQNNQNTINQEEESEYQGTFWHFNMLGDEQEIAFKNSNWVLALIEYSEEWRTNLLKKINPGDIIFLFKRGGAGYIGAFKATGNKILSATEKNNKQDIEKYDIYGGLKNGATLCSNILVEPIAYNYCGVGCKTPRRRTIERMNDGDSVELLLNRFNGNDPDVDLTGKDKLDENTPIKNLNTKYFSDIIKALGL